MRTSEEVLNQIHKPQRTIVKVCEENWNRIKQSCPDNNGDTCGITGEECSFSKCPKMVPEDKR